MTKRSAGLAAMTIAVYLFANQTNVGWLYMIAALSASVILTSILFSLLSFKGLKITRSLNTGPRAGTGVLHEDDVVEITLGLEKTGLQPTTFVSVSEHCPIDAPGKETKRFFFLPLDKAKIGLSSGELDKATYMVACYKRGVYAFPPLALESKGLLGLFCRKQRLEIDTRVTVYPKYYEIFSGRNRGAKADLDSSLPRQGHIDEFYGTREYRSGDSPRHIHWRSSARAGELIVKEFQEQTRPRITIVLDTSFDFGEGKESTLEYSVKLAATVAWYAIDAGYRLSIVAEGASPRDMSWKDTLEFLARLEPKEKLSARKLLDRPLGADVILAFVPWTDGDSSAVLPESPNNSTSMTTILFTCFPGQEPLASAGAIDGFIECKYKESLPDVASRIVQRLELNVTSKPAWSMTRYQKR